MNTQWQLKQHYYQSLDDPQIEKDVEKVEAAVKKFVSRWQDNDEYLRDADVLAEALAEYEKLEAMPEAAAPIRYAMFRQTLNANDSAAAALANQLQERLTKTGNELLFFELSLGKLDAKKQKELLNASAPRPYRYQLEQLFESARYQLSEPEERILSRKALPARSLWRDGVEKAINKLTIRWEGKDIAFPEAMGRIRSLPTQKRRRLYTKTLDALETVGDFGESELTALYTDKKISDELRGFEKPYSGMVLANENDEESVEALVEAVTNRMRISKRFYKLKKRLMRLSELTHADRSVPLSKEDASWSFKTSREYLEEVFGSVNPEYASIFSRLMDEGCVDVYPKPGKSGGAFCAGTPSLPTYVLLNHVDDMSSLMTMAHEMGHAVHTERSKQQPTRYQGHSLATAETASTLFERLTFEYAFERLPRKQQAAALHDKLQDDIATVFRQIACFNFEHALHQHLREHGALDLDTICKLHNKHMRAYFGPAVKLQKRDGLFALYWSHIRMHFYVYTYAYGLLASRAMVERYKNDHSYAEAIDTFLTAGDSKKPEDIFADIGIDVRDPNFFVEGLKSIESDIKRLEKLVGLRA